MTSLSWNAVTASTNSGNVRCEPDQSVQDLILSDDQIASALANSGPEEALSPENLAQIRRQDGHQTCVGTLQ